MHSSRPRPLARRATAGLKSTAATETTETWIIVLAADGVGCPMWQGIGMAVMLADVAQPITVAQKGHPRRRARPGSLLASIK